MLLVHLKSHFGCGRSVSWWWLHPSKYDDEYLRASIGWNCGFQWVGCCLVFYEHVECLWLQYIPAVHDVSLIRLNLIPGVDEYGSFYALRIIGLFMPNDSVYITDWSYDILASCSIFLFPRIFSVLYRTSSSEYRAFLPNWKKGPLPLFFSANHRLSVGRTVVGWMTINFLTICRIMAADMVTLLIVIIVSCSGFFVAFTFSFAREYSSATDVSWAIFSPRLAKSD